MGIDNELFFIKLFLGIMASVPVIIGLYTTIYHVHRFEPDIHFEFLLNWIEQSVTWFLWVWVPVGVLYLALTWFWLLFLSWWMPVPWL